MSSRSETLQKYTQLFQNATALEYSAITRHLALHDLFFLLVFVLGRKDANKDWLFERCREVQKNPDGYLDLWFRDGYKAEALDTPTWTITGWKNHGDLEIGDWVYSELGEPVPVIAVTPITDQADCYQIEFDDGSTIVCSGDHLWPLEKRSSRRIKGNYRHYADAGIWDARTIKKWGPCEDHVLRSPLTKPLQGSFKPLISPYVLGVWLGDGASSAGQITVSNQDIEILQHIEACGFSIGHNIAPGKASCGNYTIYGLFPQLRKEGLLYNKHIPSWCFQMGPEDRLALLQGLMDTDGGNKRASGECFTQSDKNIAEGVYFLALSLGLKPTISKQTTSCKDSYKVIFTSDVHMPVYRLHRKLAGSTFRKPRCRGSRRFIKSIHRVPPVPVKCIQVGNPTGQYLTGKQLIPTHNSTIITFGKTIQDILNNPEITVGIFSCTRPIAKAFLRQIKQEFESNGKLKTLFPEILYDNPQKSSPKWSTDEGIIVKRKSNPKESTVEAWGMVDGMPTSKHFKLMVYDDVVTKEFVNTPEMIRKTNEAWELSRNLSTVGGKTRYIGTRYNYGDTYALIMERKAAIPRIYPATDNGKPDGNPVLWTREVLQEKIREMGAATAAAQLFQDPRVDSLSNFNVDDLRYWSPEHYAHLNIYLLVDPASTKTKRSDYTVFAVMGLGEDENYYVIDIIRDRLSLTERANVLFRLHRQFRPLAVGYEQYGLQADIQHFEDRMARENYRFQIIPLGGKVKKEERIAGLQPLVEAHRFYLPDHCIHQDYQGTQVDVTRSAVEEFRLFPFSPHDDILDATSRILDPNFVTARPRHTIQSGKLPETTDSDFDPFGTY